MNACFSFISNPIGPNVVGLQEVHRGILEFGFVIGKEPSLASNATWKMRLWICPKGVETPQHRVHEPNQRQDALASELLCTATNTR